MAKDKKTPKQTTDLFLKMTKAMESNNPKPKKSQTKNPKNNG